MGNGKRSLIDADMADTVDLKKLKQGTEAIPEDGTIDAVAAPANRHHGTFMELPWAWEPTSS